MPRGCSARVQVLGYVADAWDAELPAELKCPPPPPPAFPIPQPSPTSQAGSDWPSLPLAARPSDATKPRAPQPSTAARSNQQYTTPPLASKPKVANPALSKEKSVATPSASPLSSLSPDGKRRMTAVGYRPSVGMRGSGAPRERTAGFKGSRPSAHRCQRPALGSRLSRPWLSRRLYLPSGLILAVQTRVQGRVHLWLQEQHLRREHVEGHLRPPSKPP